MDMGLGGGPVMLLTRIRGFRYRIRMVLQVEMGTADQLIRLGFFISIASSSFLSHEFLGRVVDEIVAIDICN